MDLISRKTVIEYLQEQHAKVIIEKHKDGFINEDVCSGMEASIDAFVNFIVKAPTVEAVPVVRGEWVETSAPDFFQCSNCKKSTKMDYTCDSEILRAFCPNCGADMRGIENEN